MWEQVSGVGLCAASIEELQKIFAVAHRVVGLAGVWSGMLTQSCPCRLSRLVRSLDDIVQSARAPGEDVFPDRVAEQYWAPCLHHRVLAVPVNVNVQSWRPY